VWPPQPQQRSHGSAHLKPPDLHFLELRLVLQITNDLLLSADDGAVHGRLLQVLDACPSHLQLGAQRGP
jgi:hypothetical protein